MAKPKAGLGHHSRPTRRLKHLTSLLKRTRVHSVRLALMREIQHELNRIRRRVRRATPRRARQAGGAGGGSAGRERRTVRQVFQDRAVDYARHLGNRMRHGGTHRCDGCGKDIPGGIGTFNAHLRKHEREDELARTRDKDPRTGRQHAEDHARAHLESHGLRHGRDLGDLPEDRPLNVRDLRDRHRERTGKTPREPEPAQEPRDPQPSPERAASVREMSDRYVREARQAARDRREAPQAAGRTGR
jgi:hypothetical protein